MNDVALPVMDPRVRRPTETPYRLRVNDTWVPLERITAGVRRSRERARSTFELIGGGAIEQAAPRARNVWRLASEHTTPTTNAALEVAANFPGDVWLLDRDIALANMLDPADCQGTGAPLMAGGVPLRSYEEVMPTTSMVRGGVEHFASLWTDADAGTVVGFLHWPGLSGPLELLAPPGVGVRQVLAGFTPPTDEQVGLEVLPPSDYLVTGAQLTESIAPTAFALGGRTPCRVVVSDPDHSLDWMWAGTLGHGSWSWEIREVIA